MFIFTAEEECIAETFNHSGCGLSVLFPCKTPK